MDQLGPDRKDPDADPDPTSPADMPPPADAPPADAPPADAPPAIDAATDADATQAYATPVETDAAVDTEAVEPPPVHVFVPEEHRGRRRVGGRASVLMAGLAVLAIGGVAALGYSLNQDLAATRASLASTEGDLATTKSSLVDTNGTLDATNTSLAGAKEERSGLDAQVSDLAAQVATQAQCVVLQTAALDELSRIEGLQTDNFNRTTENSTWAKAEVKRNKAVGEALNAYYQAYSKAFDRNLSSARAWAAKGKEASAVIGVQAKQQVAELALIDRSAAEIKTALDALEQQLKTTESICAEAN